MTLFSNRKQPHTQAKLTYKVITVYIYKKTPYKFIVNAFSTQISG